MIVPEDNKHGGVGSTVGNAVVQVGDVAGAFVGRGDEAIFSLGVVSHQDPGQVHASVPAAVRRGVAVCRVDGIHGKISAFAIHGSCRETDIK